MKKVNISLKVGVLILLALCLIVSSCKKEEGATGGPKTEKNGGKDVVKVTTEKVSDELVVLPFVLPALVLEGTPPKIDVPNLEKPLGKARPSFYAPKGCVNVSAGKPVVSSDEDPIVGEIEFVTDGDKAGADGSFVELGPFKQHVTVDLGLPHEIYAILLWHFHKEARVYFDVVVQIADDADFITNVRTIFNNDHDNSAGLGIGKDMHYMESSEGKLIDAEGVVAQFIRFYSSGSSANDLNHYIEAEVWGKPAK